MCDRCVAECGLRTISGNDAMFDGKPEQVRVGMQRQLAHRSAHLCVDRLDATAKSRRDLSHAIAVRIVSKNSKLAPGQHLTDVVESARNRCIGEQCADGGPEIALACQCGNDCDVN